MIKKVHKNALRLGMFIHDLNSGWMAHSFWRNRFMLRREEDLQKILESGLVEVYIDTALGLDAEAPTEEEAQRQVSDRLRRVVGQAEPVPRRLVEEMAEAKAVQQEASVVVQSMLEDARMGRQIQADRMEPVVAKITDSILRNPGALLCMNRLKQADSYTFQHSVSVCTLLVAFCRHMDMASPTIQLAGMGGMVHDLGKMQVPDHILNKASKLTNDEFEVMKSHVQMGLNILWSTPDLPKDVVEIAGQHHERFSGHGYPFGLQGTQITVLGRMAAIADVYDAMTSTRCYQQGMEPALALQKLFEWGEHHFDPELVQSFIQAVGIYPTGSLVRLESGRLGVVTDQSPAGLLYPVVRVVYHALRQEWIEPEDLDLSQPEQQDAIVGYEKPSTWGIDPLSYLTLG